ncbi:hypothetical protein [Methylobacterium iners]|uniref:RepB-like DNA primase domain-containing protein n=1 Tax=Methylobacterium iners TaxID=418707 RepID=A0ABQ4S2V4_9HYPH|nr:hypothetical protein [Methylobacterium iners]GJD97463.1 hypothetical protein OCOJLMKI_4694 [Methylobacterium iners]
MNPSAIVDEPHGASLAVPGPSDADLEPRFRLGRKDNRHLVWADFIALFHPEDSRSVAVFAYSVEVKTDEYRTRNAGAKGSEIRDVVRRHRPRFVTINSFREGRPLKDGSDYRTRPCKAQSNLASLNALWVDIDFYKKGCAYRNRTQAEMVEAVLGRCKEEGIPAPSLIMSSGKGLLALWLHERLPALGKRGCLSVWKACQQHLNELFVDMGRDIKAMSATMNFRVPGTTNNQRPVEVIWPRYVDQVHRHEFSLLRTEILPYTAEEVRAHREAQAAKRAARAAKRAEREATGQPSAPRVKLTRETFQRAVMADLEKLFDARFQGRPVEKGQRDLWLYDLTVAASWLLPPDALRDEVKRLAPLCGLTQRRALTLMGAVLRKAKAAADGKTVTYMGRPVVPLYRTNPALMAKAHGVTVEEATELDLRLLVPPALKVAREAKRAERNRRLAGAKDRRVTQAARLEFGRYALERREAGVIVDELVFEARARFDGMGSKTWVEKAMREARAVNAIGRPQGKAKVGRPRKQPAQTGNNPRGSYGSISASTGLDREAAQVVAGGRAGYNGPVHAVHLTSTNKTPAAVLDPAGVDASGDIILDERRYRREGPGWIRYHEPSEDWEVVEVGLVEYEIHRASGWQSEMTPAAREWEEHLQDFLLPYQPVPA